MKILLLFFSSIVAARAQTNSLDTALAHKLDGKIYSVSLTGAYHFNEKAPNRAVIDGGSVSPKSIEPKLVKFELPEKYKDAIATVYACDDALTFCESRKFSIAGAGEAKQKSEKISRAK